MDFSQLSDEELMQMAQGEGGDQPAAQPAPVPPDQAMQFASMSDDELMKIAQSDPSESNWFKDTAGAAMEGVLWAGNKIDSVTGAPTRAAIDAGLEGKNPLAAFAGQFAEDPNEAPTGRSIARKMGIPDEQQPSEQTSYYTGKVLNPGATFNPAKVAGFGIDVAADPLNVVGVAPIVKGTKQAIGMTAKGAKAGISGAAGIAGKGARTVPGVGTVMDMAKESAKNTSDALRKMFKPTVADDFPELAKVAKKHGIDPDILPEAVEFGEGSFISRAARNRAEGVLGEPHLKRFEQAYEAVQDATQKTVAKIAGGSIPSRLEAGQAIRKGYDDAVEELFSNVDFTYNQVIKQAPGIRLTDDSLAKINSKLQGIENFAKGRIKRGITNTEKAQGKQLMRAVEAVRAGNGSLKQTYEAMSEIGRHAFKTAGNSLADVPVDVEKFRDLYFGLRNEFINSTAAQLGDDVANSLVFSNELLTSFMKEKSKIASILGNNKLADEKLFTTLIESGDTKKIAALKSLLPPETFQQLKGSFLASQIKPAADGTFSFKTLHNSLRNKREIMGALLDPAEIEELGELIRLGSRFGSPVLSTSGTGASNLFRDITSGIRSSVESDLVIGKLKDSARGRALKSGAPALKGAAGSSRAAKFTPIPKTDQTFKKIISISPAAARVLSIKSDEGEDRPLRGEKKWTVDGFGKLLDHDKSKKFESKQFVDKVFQSAKGRRMLVSASDLKPGSKAMDRLVEKLEKEFGGNK